jgi:hypothetical protein
MSVRSWDSSTEKHGPWELQNRIFARFKENAADGRSNLWNEGSSTSSPKRRRLTHFKAA